MFYPEITPISVPLPEAETCVDFNALLRRVYEEGLPGFLIRGCGLVGSRGNEGHKEIVNVLVATLPEILERPDLELQTASPYTFKAGTTNSDLHHDYGQKDPAIYVRLHRTVRGSGSVILANSGKRMPEPYKYFGVVSSPESAIKLGAIEPTIYEADLSTDDIVIFPTEIPIHPNHSLNGPVWHEFRTKDHSRTVTLRDVMEV